MELHVRIVGATAAFRRYPGDVLGRVLDVAGLAVNAVLGVDLEPLAATVVLLNHLIHTSRAVTLGRLVVPGQVFLDRNLRIGQLQVNRLIFLMVGVRNEHRGQAVKGQFIIRLGISDLPGLRRRFECCIVRRGIAERNRQAATQDVLLEKGNRTTNQVAELVHGRAEVTLGVNLLVQPAVFKAFLEAGDFLTGLAFLQSLKHSFCAQQSGFHGGVGAFDLGAVQGAGVTAQKQTAGEAHLGQGIVAALRDRPGTVGNALAAFEIFADLRMKLETLELFKRAQVRVAVRQISDQSDVNLAILEVIQKGAAGRTGFIKRPAGGMHHQARLVFGRVDVPQFLDPDAVVLRVFTLIEFEVPDQAFAQVTTTAFGKQGVLGTQLHTRHVTVFLGAIPGNTHIAGDHAFNLTILDDGFRRGKARIHLNAQLLGLFGQPAAQVAQADDVVAMVVHVPGHKRIRDLDGLFLIAHQENIIPGYRRIQRRAALLPVREELVQGGGLEHGTGEDVRADFRAFFYYTNGQFFAGFLGQLHNTADSRQACRSATDDHNVQFHRYAFDLRHVTHPLPTLFIRRITYFENQTNVCLKSAFTFGIVHAHEKIVCFESIFSIVSLSGRVNPVLWL